MVVKLNSSLELEEVELVVELVVVVVVSVVVAPEALLDWLVVVIVVTPVGLTDLETLSELVAEALLLVPPSPTLP